MSQKHPTGMSARMATESVNPASIDLDSKSSLDIVSLINANDATVAAAVARVLPAVARAVDLIVVALQAGGRLFYVGAGTSGRLGVVDASECPPTFGVSPEMVQGVIAGGRDAVFRSREGAEDSENRGGQDLVRRGLCRRDVVCGLSGSGRTPYVIGALKKARGIGATTLAVYCNPEGELGSHADVAIVPETGAEVIAGSTRMKAGTAQKMVLNMLSTAAMVRLGRVKGNRMSHMRISCEKLRYRAQRILMDERGVDEETACRLLADAGDDLTKALDSGSHLSC